MYKIITIYNKVIIYFGLQKVGFWRQKVSKMKVGIFLLSSAPFIVLAPRIISPIVLYLQHLQCGVLPVILVEAGRVLCHLQTMLNRVFALAPDISESCAQLIDQITF